MICTRVMDEFVDSEAVFFFFYILFWNGRDLSAVWTKFLDLKPKSEAWFLEHMEQAHEELELECLISFSGLLKSTVLFGGAVLCIPL